MLLVLHVATEEAKRKWRQLLLFLIIVYLGNGLVTNIPYRMSFFCMYLLSIVCKKYVYVRKRKTSVYNVYKLHVEKFRVNLE